MVVAALVASSLALSRDVIAAAGTGGMRDSIIVETIAELPNQFTDRFVTGLAYAGRDFGAGARDSTIWFSADGLHMAYLHDRSSGVAMVVDGIAGPEYRRVGDPTFSREGGHFAYLAGPSRDADRVVVLDGREHPIDDSIEIGSALELSPDGRRFGFIGVDRSEFRPTSMFVVTDRTRGRTYSWVTPPRFSWDGSRAGYLAHKWGRYVVVIDEVESPEYEWASEPYFTPEGGHALYTYAERGRVHLVRDGEEVEWYAGSDHFVSSRDGSRIAYIAETRNGQRLVVDDEAGEEWSWISIDTTLFSPDGRRTAYWGRRGGAWSLVVDGQTQWEQTIDQGPPHPQFSPDGAHVAHVERRGWSRRVVKDGVPGRDYDAISRPRFAPRGGRIAYAVRHGDRERVVVDEVEGPGFEAVGDPSFSPEGAHLAYIAWKGKDRACVMVDGRAGPEFEVIVPNGPTFRPDGALEYLAIRGANLLRVRHAAPATRP